MIGLRILRALFPAPRRELRIPDLLPLVLFLAAFGSVCLALELAGLVLFVRREAFFLTFVIVWIWWLFLAGSPGLSPVRSQAALWIRFVMIAGFIVALAEPRAVRTSEVLSVVYAVDVSDSISQQAVDSALEFVARQVSEKPAGDEAGLVLFGAEAVVELPPRITFPFDGVVTSQIRRDATSIADALSLSAAMIPAENDGRIVLISDGVSTEGDVVRRLRELNARGISVDVLPVDYQYSREVWIERLELPQHVRLDQSYPASVLISSLEATTGTLHLRENGQLLASTEVTLRPGQNQFSLPVRVTRPGYYEYQAIIEVPESDDSITQNNSVENFLFVEGSGRILIVTAPEGNPREWTPFVEAIDREGRIIEQRDAYGFPDSTLALLPYDTVVFVNVPVNALVPAQMRALHNAVRNVGLGFLMIGGPDSFGPGGYHRTPIEQALPVSMDIEQQDLLQKGALVIILHTCEFADGNTWGKRITNQAIRVLSGQDEVGALIFNKETDSEEWLFRLTPAASFPRLVTLVNRAEIGDMPTFATTMEMGLASLSQSDASIRRMLIISDGDPSAPTDELLALMQREKITVSTVTVSPHGESDTASMKRIADATGGRAYTPDNPSELPAIFVKEARTLKRSMIQERTIVPAPGVPSSLLESLQNPPPLHGYVLTSLKRRAEPVLLAPSAESDQGTAMSDVPVPILARWKNGLGTTAAFTSDFTTRWGREWVKWERFHAVVNQLLQSLSRQRQPAELRLWTHISGGEVVVVAEDFSNDGESTLPDFSEVAAVVNGPDGYSETLRLQQVGPRRFEARVPLPDQGKYQVIVQGLGNDRTASATSGFIVSYSPEYLRFRSDPITLKQIQQQTGGSVLDRSTPASDVFANRQPRSSTRPVFDWLLISLAILLPIDVAIRRVHLDWPLLRDVLFRRKASNTESATLSSLLVTKQQTAAQFDASGESSSASSDPVDAPRTDSSPARSTRPTETKPVSQSDDIDSIDQQNSTLARLLAIKRHQDNDDQESGDSAPTEP